jgi:hypothetical protein
MARTTTRVPPRWLDSRGRGAEDTAPGTMSSLSVAHRLSRHDASEHKEVTMQNPSPRDQVARNAMLELLAPECPSELHHDALRARLAPFQPEPWLLAQAIELLEHAGCIVLDARGLRAGSCARCLHHLGLIHE